MQIKLIKVKAKTIFTKSKLEVDWVINQYVGCGHNCSYCYARFIGRWRPKDYGKWGAWVEAKVNAPELVKDKYVAGWVFMSSISDPYQPIEERLKLTRKILAVMDKRIKLAVQTKSDLVLRDIALFKKFKNIEIGLTINSFDGKSKRFFEPCSSANEKRIKALKVLKKHGLKTYVFVSPIIPGLTNLKDVIAKTKDFADYYWFEFINLRGAGKEFADMLKTKFPKSFAIVKDKERFSEFIKECKKIINKANIKVKGIVLHNE